MSAISSAATLQLVALGYVPDSIVDKMKSAESRMPMPGRPKSLLSQIAVHLDVDPRTLRKALEDESGLRPDTRRQFARKLRPETNLAGVVKASARRIGAALATADDGDIEVATANLGRLLDVISTTLAIRGLPESERVDALALLGIDPAAKAGGMTEREREAFLTDASAWHRQRRHAGRTMSDERFRALRTTDVAAYVREKERRADGDSQ